MNITQAEMKYGAIDLKNRIWPNERLWCKLYDIPFPWFPKKKIYCNEDFYYYLIRALTNLGNADCHKEIFTFDGCFNIRAKRTKNEVSVHSYALAIDLNAEMMPLGAKSLWTPKFVKCFQDAGFKWGGEFLIPDPQHFQLKDLW